MKCDYCNKKIDNPLIIKDINISSDLFLNRKFCNEVCLQNFIKENIKKDKIKGLSIRYDVVYEK